MLNEQDWSRTNVNHKNIAACVFQSFYIVVGNESALALIISQQTVDC